MRATAFAGGACALALAFGPAAAVHGQCAQEWSPGFATPELNGEIYALAYWDGGQGPGLYVGGQFGSLAEPFGKVPTFNGVFRWDGRHYQPLGAGFPSGGVDAFAVYDDGRGPALYAGGSFIFWAGGMAYGGVARWDGYRWSGVGDPNFVGGISALSVFDDGRGPALYATGGFSQIGSTPANNIARWDGQTWAALADGFTGSSPFGVALATFDDGHGPALYVGGRFTTAGGAPASNLARWDGNA